MDSNLKTDLANRITVSAEFGVGSTRDWQRVEQFTEEAIANVYDSFPERVQEQLDRLFAGSMSPEQKNHARAVLWNEIGSNTTDTSPRSSAIRAALFPFYEDHKGSDPSESIFYFCMFYETAGLPVEALEAAFSKHWPQDDI